MCSFNDKPGRPGGIRTPNPRIWSPVLSPLELQAYEPALFIHFQCARYRCQDRLTRLFMDRVGPAESAIFPVFDTVRMYPLILGSRIVPVFAFDTGKCDDIPHNSSPNV